jgi:hypothetical protein
LTFSRDALAVAASKGRKEVVEILLAHEDLDLANLDMGRSRGMRVPRAFVEAACFGQTHIMEMFLDKSLDLAAADCGQEAIDAAAVIGHKGVVRLLLDKGTCTETYSGNKRIMSLRDPCGEFLGIIGNRSFGRYSSLPRLPLRDYPPYT